MRVRHARRRAILRRRLHIDLVRRKHGPTHFEESVRMKLKAEYIKACSAIAVRNSGY